MSSEDLFGDMLNEEQADDVEADGGLDEVARILEPYMKDKTKVSVLKEKLETLGVSTLSDLNVMKEDDASEFIPIIKFRQMLKDRQNKENNAPSNTALIKQQCIILYVP